MKRISYEDLRVFTESVLVKCNVPANDASVVADCLLYSNLSGVDSHGIVRLAHYVRRLSNGTIKARPNIGYSTPRPAILEVDGDDGLGHVITARAIDRGMGICRSQGSLLITIKNSSHFGMTGYYLRDIVRAGLVGMMTTHTDVRIVPAGARKPFAGTNPIAFGFPSSGEPFVLDLSTSLVPFGKVALARTEGHSIPPDWGLDEEGNPTTDPHRLVGMHAIAGHKGSGLAMIIDLLCSMFTGMAFGPHIVRMYEEMEAPRRLGHFVALWDIGALVPLDDLKSRMDAYIAELHALPRKDADVPVLFPGEPEALKRAERRKAGLPVESGLLGELIDLGDRLAVDTAGLR